VRYAAASNLRRPLHDGQTPLPLHEHAVRKSPALPAPHQGKATDQNAASRYRRNSRSTCAGTGPSSSWPSRLWPSQVSNILTVPIRMKQHRREKIGRASDYHPQMMFRDEGPEIRVEWQGDHNLLEESGEKSCLDWGRLRTFAPWNVRPLWHSHFVGRAAGDGLAQSSVSPALQPAGSEVRTASRHLARCAPGRDATARRTRPSGQGWQLARSDSAVLTWDRCQTVDVLDANLRDLGAGPRR
jgi:hypothetical protein